MKLLGRGQDPAFWAKVRESEAYRPFFRETARIHRTLIERGYMDKDAVLSMGMSGSYGVAVEEGADIIRVGRSLFIKP